MSIPESGISISTFKPNYTKIDEVVRNISICFNKFLKFLTNFTKWRM